MKRRSSSSMTARWPIHSPRCRHAVVPWISVPSKSTATTAHLCDVPMHVPRTSTIVQEATDSWGSLQSRLRLMRAYRQIGARLECCACSDEPRTPNALRRGSSDDRLERAGARALLAAPNVRWTAHSDRPFRSAQAEYPTAARIVSARRSTSVTALGSAHGPVANVSLAVSIASRTVRKPPT